MAQVPLRIEKRGTAYALVFTPDGWFLVPGGRRDLVRFWPMPAARLLGAVLPTIDETEGTVS